MGVQHHAISKIPLVPHIPLQDEDKSRKCPDVQLSVTKHIRPDRGLTRPGHRESLVFRPGFLRLPGPEGGFGEFWDVGDTSRVKA